MNNKETWLVSETWAGSGCLPGRCTSLCVDPASGRRVASGRRQGAPALEGRCSSLAGRPCDPGMHLGAPWGSWEVGWGAPESLGWLWSSLPGEKRRFGGFTTATPTARVRQSDLGFLSASGAVTIMITGFTLPTASACRHVSISTRLLPSPPFLERQGDHRGGAGDSAAGASFPLGLQDEGSAPGEGAVQGQPL